MTSLSCWNRKGERLRLEGDVLEYADHAWGFGWVQGFLDARAIVGPDVWQDAMAKLMKQVLGPSNPNTATPKDSSTD